MRKLMSELGALRSGMAFVVALLVVASPFALAPASAHGWAIVPTVIAPALFAIFIFVLPLDLAMTLVFRSDKSGGERQRLNRVLAVETILTLTLILSWTPFVVSLVNQSP